MRDITKPINTYKCGYCGTVHDSRSDCLNCIKVCQDIRQGFRSVQVTSYSACLMRDKSGKSYVDICKRSGQCRYVLDQDYTRVYAYDRPDTKGEPAGEPITTGSLFGSVRYISINDYDTRTADEIKQLLIDAVKEECRKAVATL